MVLSRFQLNMISAFTLKWEFISGAIILKKLRVWLLRSCFQKKGFHETAGSRFHLFPLVDVFFPSFDW